MNSRVFADVSTASRCAQLFPRSVAGIQQIVADAKVRGLAALRAICNQPAPRTFLNTAQASDLARAEIGISAGILSVVKNVSPEKDLRDEANKQIIELEAFIIDNFSSNKKLYAAVKEYTLSEEWADSSAITGERRYWLEEELKEFRRRGFELPDDKFDEVVQLQKELSVLSTAFSSNVAEDKSEIVVEISNLLGVPESVVKALHPKSEEEKSLLVLKMDYPTYFGVMKNCEVAETRKRMSFAFENRAFPANLNILKDVILKRHQLAVLLGFPSYSHYDLESKMAKSPEAAQSFVDNLVPGLQKKWAKEKEVLTRKLHPSVVLTPEGNIQSYDVAFCMNNVKKTELNVDETAIREFFPMSSTVQALFDIYQRFFDITFTKMENGDELWHKDTSTLAVSCNRRKILLGHIVLDLFPREGKFSHACCHSVVPAVLITEDAETKVFSPALSVVIANFPGGTPDAPPLFTHDDVETFFHEFGHAIHGLMGRTVMASFAGTRVKRDFVELPSQMLEEWLWEPEILQLVTKHYKTGETLPQALIDAKIASKNAFSGRDSLRQLQFATYALSIFGLPFSAESGSEKLDTTRLFQSIQPKVMPGIEYAKDAHFECAFGHLMGYAATYYGYMWSEVFAQDVFQYIKDRNGLLSAELGKRYVDCIIGAGGARDPNELLKDFLGREPNAVAFLGKLGV
jgi:thimet oligopeptidase